MENMRGYWKWREYESGIDERDEKGREWTK